MDYYEMKKSGQIPAFGNWDYVNDLPITEYFECARQAGLIPPTSSDSSDSVCQCPPCVKARRGGCAADVYGNTAEVKTEFRKAPPPRVVGVPPKKKEASNVSSNNNRSNRPQQVMEQKKQVLRKANDVKGQNSRIQQKERQVINIVKPVDEDLYKIPSHLLHNSKRKKMLGFFSRCLAPPCRA